MNNQQSLDVVDAIFDFNEQVIGTAEHLELNCLTTHQYEWTVKFIDEETKEFVSGFVKEDAVLMVDGIIDLVYGALGTLKKMGLTREQAKACFAAVHAANMTKRKGVVAHRPHSAGEDAAKPADFVPPDEAIGHILFGGV